MWEEILTGGRVCPIAPAADDSWSQAAGFFLNDFLARNNLFALQSPPVSVGEEGGVSSRGDFYRGSGF